MVNCRSLLIFLALLSTAACSTQPEDVPNILLVVTDDQSWKHTSMAGAAGLATPNFDRIARSGVYFPQAYASAPSCTASRSSILAGQDFWRLGSAAVLNGRFQSDMISYQRILKAAGFHTGFTGKGWGPGLADGESPVGMAYNDAQLVQDSLHVSSIDYAANFERFLDDAPADQPFSFLLSPFEPHRPFQAGTGTAAGIDAAIIELPEFLPDTELVREDMADYYYEIQQQDAALGRILEILETRGLLENTLIVVTSDNGMPFPRAKSTNYEYGVRVPLALSWPARIQKPGINDAIVNLADLAPTFLAATRQKIPEAVNGRNLLDIIDLGRPVAEAADFSFTVTGFERHIPDAREGNRSYPVRALHTAEAVYIRNFAPERWPVGPGPRYADIDSTSPSKRVVLQSPEYLELAAGKRPAEEMYLLTTDPYQLDNLANSAEYSALRGQLSDRLHSYLTQSEDPVLSVGNDAFSAYPSY